MSMRLPLALFPLLALLMFHAVAEGSTDHWGPCPASPAVVNPPALSPLQEVISLRGEWDFVVDKTMHGRHRMGKGPDWREPDWSGLRTIEVPGCWEAQGVGEAGMSQTWDPIFDRIPRPLNHVFMGTARYRKEVEIPASWQDKRIWLKVGGVRTEAWLWVNKQRVAHLNTYCGSYKYDITEFVVPGSTAEIVATVRNDSPSRKGCMAAFHRFGGFYRDIELEATPQTRLEDVWVQSLFDENAARVHVSLCHVGEEVAENLELQGIITTSDGKPARVFSQPVTLNPGNQSEITIDAPLDPFHPWSPENPYLYQVEVTLLKDGAPLHGWVERFGVRKLEVRGDRFYLNNEPFFIRGYGDDYIYPITLISPAEREAHLETLAIARKAGFNYVRHHTHCEIPEFFEAADESGILIQPELPYYHDITTEAFPFDPLGDLQELYRHYRRYVSFASYCTGNEGHLGSPLDEEIYAWAKEHDPDRIFQHQDGGCNTAANSDYDSPNGYQGMATSIVPWKPGTFDALEMPFIAHEYLNLGIKMDPRTEPLFTGAIPAPRSMEDYEASLAKAGISPFWGDACLRAAHGLQGYYQKKGIEAARLDPACDGYSYWTLIDVMVQQENTYTGQGFLNAFWQQKEGGLSPEAFSVFNGPSALLADLSEVNAIAVSGDALSIPLWVSHFGGEALPEGKLLWELKTAEGTLLAGDLVSPSHAIGDVREIGSVEMIIPELDKPVEASFHISLEGSALNNSWRFWLFPTRQTFTGEGLAATEDLHGEIVRRYPGAELFDGESASEAALIITSAGHPILQDSKLKDKRILVIAAAEGAPNIHLGWWSLGNQLGTAFADHPIYGDFPLEESISPLWFRLIKQGLPLPLETAGTEVEYFAIGEGLHTYFSYLHQEQEEGGLPRLYSHGLDLMADVPEALWLLDQLIGYMKTGD